MKETWQEIISNTNMVTPKTSGILDRKLLEYAKAEQHIKSKTAYPEATAQEIITTFGSDFRIANAFGENAIIDTYYRGFLYAFTDYKAFTEFVIVLNHYCWQFYNKSCKADNASDRDKFLRISSLYHDLYYKARDLALTLFDSDENKHAFGYFYHAID